MFDVIFLSYNEPNKEDNWKRLLDLIPWAKRVDGVEGIPQAHIQAANTARTELFYVVDGDSEITNFPWRYKPNKKK